MSSRRQDNRTDESANSFGSSAREDAQLASQYLESTDLEAMADTDVLQRSLSVKSVIFTSSSFARRSLDAASRPELQEIIQIGEGLQGVIFEQIGIPYVYKKERPGNDLKASNLKREFTLHTAVQESFELYDDILQGTVRVPHVFEFVQPMDPFWQNNLHRFPLAYRIPASTAKMDRILPLPKVVRRALITRFYPGTQGQSLDQAMIDPILNDIPNKHCLARTYLGKNEVSFQPESFSLRNFPLDLQSMMTLGLDVNFLANAMGKAYAVMHWGAGINGDDVEFVLGTSAVQKGGSEKDEVQYRAIGFYLLDFGQCERVDLTEDVDVVYQAFKGAVVTDDNQSFIPHYQRTPELFGVFRKAYVEAGQAILVRKNLVESFNTEEFMQEYKEYAEDFL